MTERKIQVMGEGEGRGEREKLMKRSRSETQNWWSRDRRDNEWRQRRLSGDVTRVEIPTTPGFSATILRQDSPPGFSARILRQDSRSEKWLPLAPVNIPRAVGISAQLIASGWAWNSWEDSRK